jgi:hypothetical protein
MEPVTLFSVAGVTALVTASASWGVTKATLNGTVKKVHDIQETQLEHSKALTRLTADVAYIKGCMDSVGQD